MESLHNYYVKDSISAFLDVSVQFGLHLDSSSLYLASPPMKMPMHIDTYPCLLPVAIEHPYNSALTAVHGRADTPSEACCHACLGAL